MLSTDEQKKICAEYSQRGADGLVRCNKCPLVISVAYEVVCNTIGCPIYKADYTYFFSPDAAAVAWNTRLLPEPPKEETT